MTVWGQSACILFSTLPAAEQQRVEPDETPFLDILDQSVGAERVRQHWSRSPL